MDNTARQQLELEALEAMYPDEIHFVQGNRTRHPVIFTLQHLTFTLEAGYPSVERVKVTRDGAPLSFIDSLPLDTEMILDVLQRVQDSQEPEVDEVQQEESTSDGIDFDAFASTLPPEFVNYGDTFVCTSGGRGITVERGGRHGIMVSCDGLQEKDVEEFLDMTIPTCEPTGKDLGCRLLEWARANSDEGFDESEEFDVEGFDLQYLPTIELNKDRKLRILTWGRDMLKQMPADAQANFNATVLTGKGGGINLRKMNGLNIEIQARVSRCSLFPLWVSQVVRKIEAENLTCIAVNCRKGRHRSVAAAEILKKVYYPSATTTHLTIY